MDILIVSDNSFSVVGDEWQWCLGQGTRCLVEPHRVGCGIAQPLEAMRMALDENPYNVGFIREDACLIVIIITDDDDCSVSDPRFWDTEQSSMEAPLGYFSSYRCFEFGVSCDINDRTRVGERHDCRPRDDPDALLYPISRYADFLRELKDPQVVTIAVLGGDPNQGTVTVGRDDYDKPEVMEYLGARPGIRLRALQEEFHSDEDLAWAFQHIKSCMTFMSDLSQAVIERILLRECVPGLLSGCSDPGVEHGTPRAAVSCDINSRCLARCEVTDVRRRGTAEETRVELPACLSVLADGTVNPKNHTRELAYEGGYPAERDPELPVEACWSIGFDPMCTASRGAALRVSRRADPPPRTFAEVTCDALPDVETECDNGKDDDEDCLVDMEDPSCGG